MSLPVILDPETQDEFNEGYDYDEGQQDGLGESFAAVRSGIVVAAVPGSGERHVFTRQDFDSPRIILILGLAKNEAECRTETLHREGGDFDPLESDIAEFLQTLLIHPATLLLVHGRPRAELIDSRL